MLHEVYMYIHVTTSSRSKSHSLIQCQAFCKLNMFVKFYGHLSVCYTGKANVYTVSMHLFMIYILYTKHSIVIGSFSIFLLSGFGKPLLKLTHIYASFEEVGAYYFARVDWFICLSHTCTTCATNNWGMLNPLDFKLGTLIKINA